MADEEPRTFMWSAPLDEDGQPTDDWQPIPGVAGVSGLPAAWPLAPGDNEPPAGQTLGEKLQGIIDDSRLGTLTLTFDDTPLLGPASSAWQHFFTAPLVDPVNPAAPAALIPRLLGGHVELEPYRAGGEAGGGDEPLSANPYELGTGAHQEWTRGWVDGQVALRQVAGSFDHSQEFYDELAEREGRGPNAPVDPVIRILGGYDPPAPQGPPSIRIGGRSVPVADPDDPRLEAEEAMRRIMVALAADPEPFRQAFEALADTCGQAVEAVKTMCSSVMAAFVPVAADLVVWQEKAKAAVEEAYEPPHRQEERQLLKQRHRQQFSRAGRHARPGRR